MRTGISTDVTAADAARMEAIVADRGSPQKHVWRCRIVLLTAAGLGTNAIMRAAGVTKTAVWRWQERFMHEGGTLEKAREMANHADTRTTRLYDRRPEDVSLDDVERISI